MVRELTDGFPVVAQVSEALVDQIFAYTFLRSFPTMTTKTALGEIHIWFEKPTTTLLPSKNPLQNIVQISLPMIARLVERGDESTATLVVRPSLAQVSIDNGDHQLLAPMVDFRALGSKAFEVTAAVPEYREPLHTTLVEVLMARSPIVAAPLLPDPGKQVFFRSYTVAAGTSQANILGVFVDDGSETALPKQVVARCDDRAITLVPEDLVRQHIGAGLAANGLGTLPASIPGQEGSTLNSLKIELRTGHVHVSGSADASWGLISGSIEFEAWLQLWADGPRIDVHVLRTKADTDASLSFVDFFSAGIITRVLEESLPNAISSIGTSAFSSIALFTDKVPVSTGFAASRAFGDVLVLPSGFGIPVVLTSDNVPAVEYPPYLRAHKLSREFHTPHGCLFGDLIAGQNLRRFPTWQLAVSSGYNGCATCMPAFNVSAEGRIFIHLSCPGDDSIEVAPVVYAEFSDNTERFGVSVHPPQENLKFSSGFIAADGRLTFVSDHRNLVPGKWLINIHWGNWTVNQMVKVKRTWTDSQGKAQGLRTFLEGSLGDLHLTVRYE